MVRRYTSVIGMPLVDFNDGETLALLRDIIVNPETGKVEAFWVKPVGNIFANLIVQTQDILEWKKKIYIRESALAHAEDVVRITQLLSQQSPIIDQSVEGRSGTSYGSVSDLEFDDSNFFLKQIYSQKKFLGFFAYGNYFFSFKRILEVTPEKIIVDDDASSKQSVISPTLSLD